jgi:hypothetical protein
MKALKKVCETYKMWLYVGSEKFIHGALPTSNAYKKTLNKKYLSK